MRSPFVRPALAAVLAASAVAAPGLAAQTVASAPAPRPVDWTAMQDETTRVLADYLRINTTNPPGNEIATARYLQAFLAKEGIEARILDTTELGAGRANLYARLAHNSGDGSKKAVALVHHMDVVPADPRYWSMDPFSGAVKDGYLWGRGALDMKGEGIAHLMALVALKRSGAPLTRDIVFIANADEELGSTGALVFTDRHPDLLKDVEYLFTEGGENPLGSDGKVEYYGVGVAEKRTFWQKLTVKGTPSHGSKPTKQNPVPKLVAALDRIAKWETPLHVTPGNQKYFHDVSALPQYTAQQRRWLSDVRTSLSTPAARAWITSDPYRNAVLRNTISLTGLTGSNKTNVIPAEATAELDIRLLPDADPAQFLAELQRVAADTAVHFSPLLAPKAPLESPIETDMFRAIERATRDRDPKALVTTPMLTGATDRPSYRRLGIVTYGFAPFRVTRAEDQRGVHGNDERVQVSELGWGVHYLYDVLRYVQ